MIDFSLDMTNFNKKMDEIRDKLGEKNMKKVMARVLNRTITNVKTNSAKAVPKEYSLLNMQVKKTLTTDRATNTNLKATMNSEGGFVPLVEFPHKVQRQVGEFAVSTTVRGKKKKKTGKWVGARRVVKHAVIKVKVKKSSGFKLLSGADPKPFYKTGKNRGIYARKDKRKYPIFPTQSISIPQTISNKEVIEGIQKKAQETLDKRVDHEINYELSKIK